MVEKKPRIINSEELDQNPDYEPPLKLGIADVHTTGSETITMGRTIIPPRARNQRHYHANKDACFFVRKGKLKIFLGPDGDIEEHIAPENHFIYAPAGSIHGLENLTDETAEVIFTYGNCPDKEAAGTTYVEDRWDL